MSNFRRILDHHSDYVFERNLGSGKAAVLLIKYLLNSKNYVFKIFSSNDLVDTNSHPSCVQEKLIHSSLSHPNIIKYISDSSLLSSISSENVIAMEYAPYGDFFNLVLDYAMCNEKLIRTFFHHLIEGLEYIHSKNIAHLDLKLENLLLGEDFLLKIADFDLSQRLLRNEKNKIIAEGGTANYRPPEVLEGICSHYMAADIYSAGVCLYVLMAGAFPFFEEEEENYNDSSRKHKKLFRYDTYLQNNDRFWNENEELLGGKIHFSQSFKELINLMWKEDPNTRITLDEVKESRWYNESVYTYEELRAQMKKILMEP